MEGFILRILGMANPTVSGILEKMRSLAMPKKDLEKQTQMSRNWLVSEVMSSFGIPK